MSNCLECRKNGTEQCIIYYYKNKNNFDVGSCSFFEKRWSFPEGWIPPELPVLKEAEGIKGLTEGAGSLINDRNSSCYCELNNPIDKAVKKFNEEHKIELPKYKAQIDMGGFIAQVNKTYTEEQIEHIRDYFGWEVKNYE